MSAKINGPGDHEPETPRQQVDALQRKRSQPAQISVPHEVLARMALAQMIADEVDSWDDE